MKLFFCGFLQIVCLLLFRLLPVACFPYGLKTKVVLNRLCSLLKDDDCVTIAKYIFEMNKLNKGTVIRFVRKYSRFALWPRGDLAIKLVDELHEII